MIKLSDIDGSGLRKDEVRRVWTHLKSSLFSVYITNTFVCHFAIPTDEKLNCPECAYIFGSGFSAHFQMWAFRTVRKFLGMTLRHCWRLCPSEERLRGKRLLCCLTLETWSINPSLSRIMEIVTSLLTVDQFPLHMKTEEGKDMKQGNKWHCLTQCILSTLHWC